MFSTSINNQIEDMKRLFELNLCNFQTGGKTLKQV